MVKLFIILLILLGYSPAFAANVYFVEEDGNALFSATGAVVEAEILEDDDPLVFNGTAPDAGDFKVGSDSSVADANVSIDYIHIYTEWITVDPNA